LNFGALIHTIGVVNKENTIRGLRKLGFDISAGNLAGLQNPGVVRMLNSAVEHLKDEPEDQLAMAGKKWTEAEDQALTIEWFCEKPLEEVAKSHQRSINAVAMRSWYKSAPVVKLLLENAGKLPLPS
jgi:hypothetical protein